MFYFSSRMIENKRANLSTQEGRKRKINSEKVGIGITRIEAEKIFRKWEKSRIDK